MFIYVYFSESRIFLPIIIHRSCDIIVSVWSLDEYAHNIFKVTCKSCQGMYYPPP
jgi:hypothetical protein